MARKIRKPKAGEDTHLSVMLEGALVLALDAEAARMTAEHPGLRYTRTDVLRVVLYDWAAGQK